MRYSIVVENRSGSKARPGTHGQSAGAYGVPVEEKLPRDRRIQPALHAARHGALGLRPSPSCQSAFPLRPNSSGDGEIGKQHSPRRGKARELRTLPGIDLGASVCARPVRPRWRARRPFREESSRLPGMSFWGTLTTSCVTVALLMEAGGGMEGCRRRKARR